MTQDRHTLQATGQHPAPCARFCEATAFNHTIRRIERERDELLAAINRLLDMAEVANIDSATIEKVCRAASATATAYKIERQSIDEKLREEYRVGFDGPPAD